MHRLGPRQRPNLSLQLRSLQGRQQLPRPRLASHLPRRIVDAMSSGLPVRHATIQRNLMTKRFKRSWRRSSAGDLYDFISTAMPEDAPGSLPPAQYAEIIAYFLQMNGLEAGSMEIACRCRRSQRT